MSHGAGGRLSAQLFEEVFAKNYPSPELLARGDSAVLDWSSEDRLAVSTDAFVVQPVIFPGGDIGKLSVYGTVNDLAVQGAEPVALTMAWVLEEGFPIEELAKLACSVGKAAAECSIRVVAGDTKVVERGRAHGCYIATTGIGRVKPSVNLSPHAIRSGDCILISGPIGDHGMAIMSQRAGLVFDPPLYSDAAPLHRMTLELIAKVPGLRCMRDPTRGGIAASLNELANACGLCFEIQEACLPVRPQVHSACDLLGLDPWIVANEGKLIAIVPPESVEISLQILRSHSIGSLAAQIGTVQDLYRGLVIARTLYGTQRIVPMPAGELLPRIC
ncbi:MAG: hydrogenase expression/formation protein HypE [Planctomycetota bacterium]|nr:hydrogenase expression/formation protein HypE [Planctomycetota bacterium]